MYVPLGQVRTQRGKIQSYLFPGSFVVSKNHLCSVGCCRVDPHSSYYRMLQTNQEEDCAGQMSLLPTIQ